jgi:hypothetical protein
MHIIRFSNNISQATTKQALLPRGRGMHLNGIHADVTKIMFAKQKGPSPLLGG